MSVSVLGTVDASTLVPPSEIEALASRAGLKIQSKYLSDWSTLLSGLNHCAKLVSSQPDPVPAVDLSLYPRTSIHRPPPSERDSGGWATKATVVCTRPTSHELAGKTITLKDNIALAGVPCTNGTGALAWTPRVDAVLVTRILDAGGTISGKAACENNCFGAVSDTSVTGPVHNPYAHGYSCGGSSSGSARLVATRQCWASVGGDQGGSIRLPAANCGIVGLKPTWGCVPYTGVEFRPHGAVQYARELDAHLARPAAEQLRGVRVGVLKEGFEDALQDAQVAATVRAAAARFAGLGAEVVEVSVPAHADAALVWMVALPMAGTQQGLLGAPSGRRQLLFPERAALIGDRLSQAAFDKLGPGGQNIYLRALFLRERFGAALGARCTNLVRAAGAAYDAALRDVDVLVMPTVPFPAARLRRAEQLWADGAESAAEMGPLAVLARTVGATSNTCAFNGTGHPGLSLPVGFVDAGDAEGRARGVRLPTGMQVVGRRWEDGLVLRVAGSWEGAADWRSFTA